MSKTNFEPSLNAMQTTINMKLGTRLGSMILDHCIMCCVGVILGIPFFIIGFFLKRHLNLNVTFIVGILVFVIYFCKDILNGKSPAKRLLGLQVVDLKTGQPASKLQTIIRNITIPLWPLEVLCTLFSKNRRIGDLLAGTKVKTSNKESLNTIPKDLKQWFTGG